LFESINSALQQILPREQVANRVSGGGSVPADRTGNRLFDDCCLGTATELPLREQVANALVNKGSGLGALDRSAEAIAVYDDLLARFDTATELPLREQVAKAQTLRATLHKS
jgi:hypothetical protein